ncbi:hypothetical protein F1654_08620 [Alkalicaulis satelles]|uniref:Uncharacterized protein n=1 Tax=Alkalicaulis satelles TaxID=2609175 RepID=A0A5M6ZGH7_9PROT|nr:hypothetical protein [Alkalicaulis satelles]KAA5803852.1 hypothetical protein F1654_08620 [Alkalicaulis satelles]
MGIFTNAIEPSLSDQDVRRSRQAAFWVTVAACLIAALLAGLAGTQEAVADALRIVVLTVCAASLWALSAWGARQASQRVRVWTIGHELTVFAVRAALAIALLFAAGFAFA